MIFEILEDFEAETPSGTLMLKKGQRVKIPENEAIPLIDEGLISPVIQECRRPSYEQVAMAKFNKAAPSNAESGNSAVAEDKGEPDKCKLCDKRPCMLLAGQKKFCAGPFKFS